MFFHNGSIYDYYFIIKELREEFKEQFSCLGENTKKHITSSVAIEKEVKKIGKNGKENTKIISYRLQFIDSARFMAISLSNLVNNHAKGIHKVKCKYGHYNEKCEMCGIKYKDFNCCPEYKSVKDDLIEYKSFCCNKNCQKKFGENSKKRFANTYKFSNDDIK